MLLKSLSISSDGLALVQGRPKLLKHHCCVIDNFARRLQVCLQSQGGHLEHILERTYKSDYFTYNLEALCNDPAQTEINVHQI